MYKLTWESHWLENDLDGIEKYELQYKNDELNIFEWRLFAFIIPTIGIYSPNLQWFFTDTFGEFRVRSFNLFGIPSTWFSVTIEQVIQHLSRRKYMMKKVKASDIIKNISEEEVYQKFKKNLDKFELKGIKIYDPRDNSWKVSDNPALVIADLACRGVFKTSWRLDKALDNSFWDKIAILADFCDEKI